MEHVTRLAPKTGFSFQMLISRQQRVDHASNDRYRSLALIDSTIVKSRSFHFNKFLSSFYVRPSYIRLFSSSSFLFLFASLSLFLSLLLSFLGFSSKSLFDRVRRWTIDFWQKYFPNDVCAFMGRLVDALMS